MRELTYLIATTLDGRIAREDGSFDFFPAGGPHLDHVVAEYPETIPGHLWDALAIDAAPRHFDCVLMGRKTYEVGLELGVTSPYPHLEQYLFSSTLDESPDPAGHLVRDDAAAVVEELKHRPGPDRGTDTPRGIWLCGGAHLAGTLLPQIDRLILKISPVTLGPGIPLFAPPPATDATTPDPTPAPAPVDWTLVSATTFDNGVALHEYRRA